MNKHQIVSEDLIKLIYSDEHQIGEKIPSIRSLSIKYNCSKSTIIRALNELEKNNLIYAKDRSGYYSIAQTLYEKKLVSEEINFTSSSPDERLFPHKEFQHCINEAISLHKKKLFSYNTNQCFLSLLIVIKKYLEQSQNYTKVENIVVTSGAQHSLFILTVIPFPNNKKYILIEQPSYHIYVKYLEHYNIPIKTIQRTSEGIDLNLLEQLFATGDIKFFYTIPYHHNPLGTTLSKKEKEKILKLADKYDVYIVEDDHFADFNISNKDLSLYSQDINNRVIYIRTFSKVLFPGLRIGFSILPEFLHKDFIHKKQVTTMDSSMLSQAALEIYLRSGMFDYHKKSMIKIYNKRSNILNNALNEFGLRKLSDTNALQTIIDLDESIDSQKVIQLAEKENIILVDAGENYIEKYKDTGKKQLKISVSCVEELKIRNGIKKISTIINNLKK